MRVAIIAFRGKLVNACVAFEKVTQWHDFIKTNLDPIMRTFGDAIPDGPRKKIEEILARADHTREGLQKSCQLLQGELGKLVTTLTPNWLGNLVTGVFLTGVIAVGVGVYFLNSNAVKVAVTNQGCPALPINGNVPISLPGIALPGKPISSGEMAAITLPAVSATVDASQPGTISLTIFGSTTAFQIDPKIRISLDGKQLIGKKTALNFGSKPTYNVIVSCN